MKRVLVIGCPGSGKSTFSKALSFATGLPLYHLDLLYWRSDGSAVEREVFLKRLSKVLEEEAWILDGDYASTLEMRLAFCDTVFFLDYPAELCLLGIKERQGVAHSDLPWIEKEEDPQFLERIQSYSIQRRPKVLALLEQQKGKKIYIFKNRAQAEKFLKEK